jgi:hypothetical protein
MAGTISDALGQRSYPVFRVPASVMKDLPTLPRLRRASAISRFAAAAGMAALHDAGLTIDPADASRTALIFAVANGGVIYTKRFYQDIVASGANTASPLLFPETVFNASASHLAALLGITGTSYTLVGDGAVGVLALRMAEDLPQAVDDDHQLRARRGRRRLRGGDLRKHRERDDDAQRRTRRNRRASPFCAFREFSVDRRDHRAPHDAQSIS